MKNTHANVYIIFELQNKKSKKNYQFQFFIVKLVYLSVFVGVYLHNLTK